MAFSTGLQKIIGNINIKHLHNFSYCMFVMSLLCFPLSASAYKVGTHVWVAQQVLNDLEDGKVTIPLGGVNYEATVDPAIVNALRLHPAEYRMGNIGPDAFPDVITGQMVVHPGIPGAWKTDDWLRYLLSQAQTPDQVAFTYGYLGHAAADVFAHTYVNQYSGDIFLLGDGELDVEKRHVALENYMEVHTPALLDARGTYLGQPYEVVATPTAFLRDKLILNDTVSEQNFKGKMLHLSLAHQLRKSLDATHPLLREIDILITRAVVYYYTEINLNDKQAAELYDFVNKLHQTINANNGLDQIQQAKNNLTGHIEKAIGVRADIENRLNSAMVDLVNAKSRVDQAALDLLNKQLELGGTLNQICRSVLVPQQDCNRCCRRILGRRICEPVCRATCEAHNRLTENICELNPAYVTLQLTIATLERQKADADQLLLKTLEGLRAATVFAHDSSLAIIQAENAAFNGFIDSLQILTRDLNPVRAHIDGWIMDITNGMEAYLGANGEFIKEAMKPSGDPLRPLQEWKDCWGYAVTGMLLGPANNALCTVQNRLQKLQDAMTTFENGLLSLNPVGEKWVNFKQELDTKVKVIATDLAYQIAEKVTGVDVKQFVELYTKPVDAATLNSVFAVDNSAKNLLLIGDIASRVNEEMYLVRQGPVGPMAAKPVFDPQRYATVHNAVVLAKLALLGPQQLNQLASYAGVVGPTIYPDGAPLYDNTGTPPNLLVDSIGSIDGNHQWMEIAPPYPRRHGFRDTDWPAKREYGYAFNSEKGFRLWQDDGARENLFRKIFKGPLVPGLETPQLLGPAPGFTPVLSPDYPYVVCEANPYPVSVDDRSCTAVPGQPRISASIGTPVADAPGVMYIDLRLANTGAVHARNISVNQLLFRTLAGSGTVTTGSATVLPKITSRMDIGRSATIRLYVNVPSTVTRFSINETGTAQDSSGVSYNFSLGQVVRIP